MRLVLDTCVVVAAMRSPAGASAALLMRARKRKVTLLANVALALEYEKVANRRADFAHKFSTSVVEENSTIACETLNLKGMSRNLACQVGQRRRAP